MADHLPKRCHNTRRAAWIEIAAFYGVAVALLIWNWW